MVLGSSCRGSDITGLTRTQAQLPTSELATAGKPRAEQASDSMMAGCCALLRWLCAQ